MDNRAEVREFLSSRRGRITPEQAGVQQFGTRRRVTGLRRAEVAQLAGVSVDYYTRLERGNLTGASDSVLDAIASALQLDRAEHDHLYDLARAANTSPTRPRTKPTVSTQLPATVQYMLDAITDAPAIVGNNRMDIVAANTLGYALYSDMFRGTARPANHSRFIFLDPRAYDFYPTGTVQRTSTSRSSDATPAASPTTPGSQPSSESSPSAATSSAPAGPPTTCAATTPARRASSTPPSGISNCRSKAWNSKTSPVTPSPSTPPSPAPPPQTH